MTLRSRTFGFLIATSGTLLALMGPGAKNAQALTGPCIWNESKQDWDYPPEGSGEQCTNESYSEGVQRGYVATRGAVLDKDTQKPIWADYAPDRYSGNLFVPGVPKKIAVATGVYEDAQVIGKEEAAFSVARYHALVAQLGSKLELVERHKFPPTPYLDQAGTPISFPIVGLNPRTTTIAKLKEKFTPPGTNPFLGEFPLDPSLLCGACTGAFDETQLHTNYLIQTVDQDGEGSILYNTSGPLVTDSHGLDEEGTISYLSAFFGEVDPNEGSHGFGFCNDNTIDPNSRQILDDLSTHKVDGIPARDDVAIFAGCDANRVGFVWAPIVGGVVDAGARYLGPYATGGIETNYIGRYDLPYPYIPMSTFWDTMYLQLNYHPFDVRSAFNSRYYVQKRVPAGATLEFDIGKFSAFQTVVTGLGGGLAMAAFQNTTTDTQKWRTVNFPVEVAFMDGYIAFVNEARPGVPSLAGDFSLVQVNEDDPLPKSKPPNYYRGPKPDAKRENVKINPVTMKEVTGEGGGGGEAPTITRVRVPEAGAFDPDNTQGLGPVPDGTMDPLYDSDLLKDLGRSDFANTDIHVFGPAGDLVTTRIGLRQNESPGLTCPPGYSTHRQTCTVSEANPGAVVPISDFIRNRYPGARYKVIAVNRSTGYMGTGYVEFTGKGQGEGGATVRDGLSAYKLRGDTRIQGSPVLMRAPNLSVEVKRIANHERSGSDLCKALSEADARGQGHQGDLAECEQVIGFEGGGLSDDEQIAITTDWRDWDGSPLPRDLPGFTGRLSRVTEEGKLAKPPQGDDNAGDLSHFQIKPGRHIQVVRLPDAQAYHYYLHVSGANIERCGSAKTDGQPLHESWEWFTADSPACASFAKGIKDEFDDPQLSDARPARFVPIKVAIFDAIDTADAVQGRIDATKAQIALAALASSGGTPAPAVSVKVPSADPVYKYVYRAEAQFSVYDLKDFDAPELVTKYDPNAKTGKTSLSFGYDLSNTGGAEPLPALGSDKDLIWSLGFAELLAFANKNNSSAKFDDLETLLALSPAEQLHEVQGIVGQLTPDDYLSLQLYLGNDRGNPLFIDRDIAYPLVDVDVTPITVYRRESLARFASDVQPPPPIQEGYQAIPFQVARSAWLTIKATPRGLKPSDPKAVVLVPRTKIDQLGKRYFMLDGAQLTELKVPDKFTLHFEAEEPAHADGTDPGQFKVHRSEIKVTRETVRDRALGEIVEHEVNILDGSLRLSRGDFDLGGKGPTLALSRFYSNLGSDADGLLGPGWSHSFDLRLAPTAIGEAGSGPVPPWVKDLRKQTSVCVPGDCVVENKLYPNGGVQLTGVMVNGTSFRYQDGPGCPTAEGCWKPERGRHVSLTQHCQPADPNPSSPEQPSLESCFEFVAKDGTHYFYDYPKTKAPKPPTLSGQPTMLSLQDELVERMGLTNFTDLRIGDAPQPGRPPQWTRTTLIHKIVDRYGYELDVDPDTDPNQPPRVGTIREAETGRKCTFHYKADFSPGCDEQPPEDKPRLFGVSCLEDATSALSGPLVINVRYCYDAFGNLQSATRGDSHETYRYSPEPEKSETSDDETEEEKKDKKKFNLAATTRYNDTGPQETSYFYRQGTGKFKPGVAPEQPEVDGFDEFDMVDHIIYPSTWVADGSGDVATPEIDFGYTGHERTVSDPRGPGYEGVHYSLNAIGNPKTIQEANGKLTTLSWSYDDGNSSPCGASESEDNQVLSRTVIVSPTMTVRTSYAYDADGNITRECVDGGSDGQLVTTKTFGPYGQLQSRTDIRGVTESWSYESDGFMSSHTDGSNVVTVFGRSGDNRGRPGSETITSGDSSKSVAYGYDGLGKLTSIVIDGVERRHSTYDLRGRLETETDALQRPTTYVYDDNDRLRFQNLAGVTADVGQNINTQLEFQYDKVGNKTYEKNRNGLEFRFDYTQRNELRHVTRIASDADVPSHERDLRYDAAGNLRQETDWRGNKTEYVYDHLGNLLNKIDALGTTVTERDAAGNVTRYVDPAGLAVDITYDAVGREKTRKPDCPAAEEPECALQTTTYHSPPTAIPGVVGAAYSVDIAIGPDTTVAAYDGCGRAVGKMDALLHPYTMSYDALGRLWVTVDEEGVTTTRSYDNFGYLSQTKVTGKNGSKTITTDYVNNAVGKVLFETVHRKSGEDLVTESHYDNWDRLILRIPPGSNPETFSYDGEGAMVSSTDAGGRTRTWKRNKRGEVLEYTDAETAHRTPGQPTSTSSFTIHNDRINGNGQVELSTDARGVKTEVQYDEAGRPKKVTQALGTSNERYREMLDFDGVGNPHTVKDFRKASYKLEYNHHHRLKSITDPIDRVTAYTYDRFGQVATEKNPRGYTRSYVRDAVGRLTDVFYPCDSAPCGPDKLEAHYDNDNLGHVVLERNRRGSETHYEYDDVLRLEFVKRGRSALTTIAQYEYDGANNVTAITDANHNRTEFRYNERNLLKEKILPEEADEPSWSEAARTETREYYDSGALKKITAPTLGGEQEQVTEYEYDQEDRVVKTTVGDESTTFQYDLAGHQTRVVQPEGQPGGKYATHGQDFHYDDLGRVDLVTDEVGLSTKVTYDAADHVTDVEGPFLGAAPVSGTPHTRFAYDEEVDRLKEYIQFRGATRFTTQYQDYDEHDNVKTLVDATGRLFTYTYDSYDRRTTASYPNAPTHYYEPTSTSWDFDDMANKVTITQNKKGPTSNVVDQVIEQFDQVFDRLESRLQRNQLVSYEYDDNGNREQVKSPSGTTDYRFNSLNQVKSATFNGGTTRYHYHTDGRVKDIQRPNGTTTELTYWPRTRRVDQITHTFQGGEQDVIAYTFDKNGNPTMMGETRNGVPDVTTFDTYDASNRLVDFTQDGKKTHYDYDGHNRGGEKVAQNGITQSQKTFVYDDLNQLKTVTQHIGAAAVTSYSYDDNGNLVTREVSNAPAEATQFEYDSLDQLVRVTRGPPGSEQVLGRYDYDANGLRIRSTDGERGTIETINDDSAPLEEHIQPPGGGAERVARYHYGEELLAIAESAGTRFYHQDFQGSTKVLTDSDGLTVTGYKQDPWGNVREKDGDPSDNRATYTGQEFDESTGLYYYGARYYDPVVGRFLTQDSVLGEAARPASLHRYLYASSNPGRYTDPTGHGPLDPFIHQMEEEDKGLLAEAEHIADTSKRVCADDNDACKAIVDDLMTPVTTFYGIVYGCSKLGEFVLDIGDYYYTGTTAMLGKISSDKFTEAAAADLAKQNATIRQAWDKITTAETWKGIAASGADTVAGLVKGDPHAFFKLGSFIGQDGLEGARGVVNLIEKAPQILESGANLAKNAAEVGKGLLTMEAPTARLVVQVMAEQGRALVENVGAHVAEFAERQSQRLRALGRGIAERARTAPARIKSFTRLSSTRVKAFARRATNAMVRAGAEGTALGMGPGNVGGYVKGFMKGWAEGAEAAANTTGVDVRLYRQLDMAHAEKLAGANPAALADPRLVVEMPFVGQGAADANAAGWLRSASTYWEEIAARHPDAFSPFNRDVLAGRVPGVTSPVNDATFRAYFRQFDVKGLRGKSLVHHHIGGGGQATALPSPLHPGYGGVHNLEKALGIWGAEDQTAGVLQRLLENSK